ncbi:PAS domain S-box protein [Brevibacillus reuszeri]|uniref:PAS domain-containing sensor histidine kinase n=1 Tax=Brevibacillus reuszeri TaxID=54915 RepID=UPI00366BC31C
MKQVSPFSIDYVLLLLVGWVPIQAVILCLSPDYANTRYFILTQLLFTFFVVFWMNRLLKKVRVLKMTTLELGALVGAGNDQRKKTDLATAVLHQMTDAVAILDQQGKIVLINQAFLDLTGYEEEKLIGRKVSSGSEELTAIVERHYIDVLEGKGISGLEMVQRRPNGTTVRFLFDLVPLYNQTKGVVGIVWRLREVDNRHHTELFEEGQENFHLITENMTDMVFVYGQNRVPKYISASLAMLLGYTADELMQMEDRSKLIHPEDLEKVEKVFTSSWTKETVTTILYRMLHRDGHWLHVESRYKPIKENGGKVDSIMILSRDVTELIRAKELLRQSDKLSALGQLAAGIAHEIRNPLTSLRGFVQLLQSSLEDNQKRYCEIMLAELDRINFIVSELLVLAKPQGVKYQQKDIAKIVGDVISFLDSQANLNNIQIHTSIQSKLPFVSCEENQLKQVFLNICKNAIEALPDGGEIYVEVVRESSSYLRVCIRDTGCGIDSVHIPRLGEPFYTTKENGTGLGLMISSRILEDHGGSIRIESKRQQGTTVSILLPVSASS